MIKEKINKNKYYKYLVMFFMLLISFIFNTKAYALNINTTNITVIDKSSTITVDTPVMVNNEITSNITFNEVNDYVTFELTINNSEKDEYKVESIKDNNTNKNIVISYDYSKDYFKGDNKIKIKMLYKNKLINQEKISLNNLNITINLVNDKGESQEIIINNPTTSDNILMYLVLLIIALTGLVFTLKKTRVKGIKIGSLVILISMFLLPFAIFALERYEVKIRFTDIEIKGEFEKYNITINPGNGSEPIIKEVTYGEKIGELPADPSKEGYEFEKWVDNKGNEVTEDTVVAGPISVEAKYKAVEYIISYDLDGGTVTGNPEKYTIESNNITLKNPTKEGYTFTGWTGTGIDTKTTSVTIEKGSIGNRDYTAHYSASEDTAYKVIHKYAKLNGDYEIEEVTEYGETGAEVEAPIKSKTGFIDPSVQRVTIKADGTSEVTYTYEREIYAFSISDRTYIDSVSTADGNYPYETKITVKAQERAGYDFVWSDGETDLEREFNITEPTSLTPVYTAKTNTPYKVVHQKQKIDGTYEVANTEILTGTTDASITPEVKTYEGFTSPEAETTTIKGDGTTVVTYNYTRNKYILTIENPEYVEEDKSGEYYYEEEVTLKAKTRQGYDFAGWSNGETTKEISVTIGTENITVKPIYTNSLDTTYKIEHEYERLNGDYKIEEEVLTGETGKEVEAPLKPKTGFVSPSVQRVTITADGKAKVTYTYNRERYDFSVTNRTNLENESTANGRYPYETEIYLKAKEKVGYTFAWSDDETSYERTFELTRNTELSLVYIPNIYTVEFDPNTGVGEMASQEMSYDEKEALSPNTFTKTGYLFVGWNTASDGTGTSYEDEEEVENLVPTGTIKLYAQWIVNPNTSYTVNHYKQNITLDGYDLEETENLTGATNSEVTPSVKTYEGFTSPEAQTVTIAGDGTTVVNYNYTRNSYTYSIEDENVISSLPEGEYPYGTEITVSPKDIPGYTFEKWDDENTDNPRTIVLNGDVSIKPVYKANTYNIVFNSNGGEGSMSNEEMTYDVSKALTKNTFNRTGYTFDKWNTASDGTGTNYNDEAVVKNLAESGNANLYALWNANELIFNGDDTISKVYSSTSQEVTITGASNGTGTYTYTEVSEKKDNVDTDYITINNTTITLSSGIPTGVYTYIVKATDTNSGSEKNATFVVTITKQKSEEVTNLNVTPEGIVTWTNSSNSDGYLISIDGINYTPVVPGEGTTSVNYLDQITGEAGNRTVYVKATNSDGDNYEVSDPVTKEVTVYTLNTSVNNDEYGTISTSSTNVINGVTYTTSDTTLTLSDNRSITTTKKDITGYTTTFTGWSSNSGSITQDTSVSANYTRVINKYTVTINSNGGVFTPTEGWTISGDTATKEIDYNTTITTFPEVTKTGYTFAGWNTKEDGTGTSYSDGESVTLSESITLYAQWMEAQAMFDTGQNVNAKMKKLAGSSSELYTTVDTNITSIQKSTTKPNISSMTSDNIVSITNETYNTPIYMWYDNGTIYWWSEDSNPSLNQKGSFMFLSLKGLTNLDVSSFDTSKVTNMHMMFGGCSSLTSLDLGDKFDTSNVTIMSAMFDRCSSLATLDLGNKFNTSSVTSMASMFYNCSSLTTLDLGDKFDTSNVTNMTSMFRICSSLTSLDLGDKFDTSNVKDMSSMFSSCSSLTSLDLGDKFDTSKVTTMAAMFQYCSSLTSLDLGDKFDESKVTTMYRMFYVCSSLTSLDLGDKFDTSSVTSMSEMFYNCESLTSLDLGDKFDTSNVTDMEAMFSSCSNLKTIYVTNSFIVSSVTNSTNMFLDDTKLVGGMGTTYSSSHINKEYAHIDGGTSNPGYFTARASDKYTVSFNSNGGGEVSSITVNAGESIQSFTTPTAPSGKVFDGWYTGESDGTKITAPYTPEGDITLYAHWNNNSFSEVFSEPGECTFNGSSGVLTGDNCSYANGTNKYIDTGINLYNNENHDKDYEIGFTIVSYNPSEQVKQATFMNTKLEGNNYPGLVFRRRDNYDNLDFSSRKTSSTNERKFLDYTDGMKVKIYRIYNADSDVQEIFYSINGEEKVKLNDLSQFNPEFDLSVWFGAAPTNAAATAAQRILVNTTLKDMYIKLGTYQESSSTDKYKVTYNANGGSVSPTSKTINIGDQIGTLPTPTPPTNKTFDGWYTELTGGIKVTSSYIPNNNITIYARYYNDISGATISPSSISILNGGNETITVSNVEEEYTFSSNDTNIATVDSTGKVTGTGVGTTTITITGSTSGKTRTINVTVEPSSYTVTLNANGGSVNPTSITVNNGDSVGTLPEPTPPTNKTFDGWYTELTGGIKVTSSYVPNSNITIYARYKNPTYTISFDAGEGSAVNDIEVEQGNSIGTLPTSTRNGYILEGWYEENTYEIKVTSSTIPTGNVTYYAKWEELKVCANNENITRLSENTCSNNENITIGDGIVCKRAVKLHEETCSQTSNYCYAAGYTTSGSKGTSTITYGSCGTSGTLASGDAFTCDVNGDGDFDELTERFYYVSDYYDTSAKEFDTSTAVLIYYNNVTSGVSCNKNTFAYDSSGQNYNGPRTLVSQLPTTSQWSNVELKNTTRQILTQTGTTSTSGGTLPEFDYSGYAARFITTQELNSACGITIGSYREGELDSCNYIMENTKYAKSSIESYGPWLETPQQLYSSRVWYVIGGYRYVDGNSAGITSNRGARPAIEVLKSKISY